MNFNEFVRLESLYRVGAVLLLVLTLWFIYRVGRALISSPGSVVILPESAKARATTARSMAISAWKYFVVIVFLGGLLTLTRFGLSIGTVIAASAGLLAALGAQSILKDVFAGLSVMIEGQYTVGDRVTLLGADVEGRVEGVGLRVTVIREPEGSRVFVPNGSVTGVRVHADAPRVTGAPRSGRSDNRPQTRRPRRTSPGQSATTTPPTAAADSDSSDESEAAAAERRRRRRGGRGRGNARTTGTTTTGNPQDSGGAPPQSGSTPSSVAPSASPQQSDAPTQAPPPLAPPPQAAPVQPPEPSNPQPQPSDKSDSKPPRETPWSIE